MGKEEFALAMSAPFHELIALVSLALEARGGFDVEAFVARLEKRGLPEGEINRLQELLVEVERGAYNLGLLAGKNRKLPCLVACRNASGQPDIFGCVVVVPEDAYQLGEHYGVARDAAAEAGYDVLITDVVFDHTDPGFTNFRPGAALQGIQPWDWIIHPDA